MSNFEKTTQDVTNKATRKIEETLADAQQKASKNQAIVASYIKANPLKSLTWAALTGVVLGAFLRT